jgi:NAD(P)-dependent dehydrogenase (short-subunit alcohol dehydrogenase family)
MNPISTPTQLCRFNLTGKTALITGAAGMLGIEHSSALLEAGAAVVLTDVNRSALSLAQSILLKSFDPRLIQIEVMDVCSLFDIQRVRALLVKSGFRIDILINNAAVDPKIDGNNSVTETSRLELFPVDQWNSQIAVGLTGAFLCCQVFGTAMAGDGRGGVIVNIASDLSVVAPDQRIYRLNGISEDQQPVKPVSYSVVKSGLVGLTRYIATYWADQGVRANALSPGGIFNDQGSDFVRKLSALIPLGRMARKDEYRAAIQFLSSDASSYMTGQNIVIDGGRSVW